MLVGSTGFLTIYNSEYAVAVANFSDSGVSMTTAIENIIGEKMDPMYEIRKIFENESIADFSDLTKKVKDLTLTTSAIFGITGISDNIFIFHKPSALSELKLSEDEKNITIQNYETAVDSTRLLALQNETKNTNYTD